MTYPTRSSLWLGQALLLAMPVIAACGKTVPPPAEPPVSRRSADEIIAAARLSPEAAPRVVLDIQRLDAFASCSAALTRFEGLGRVKAADAGAGLATAGIVGGVVIGGLGLVGGIVTTALAAGVEPPAFSSYSPDVNAELPDVPGKTGVIVAGVLTGVAVVAAAVITVVIVAGAGDDDDDDKKKILGLPGTGALGGAVGGVGGQVGGAVGGATGAVGGATGVGVGQPGGVLGGVGQPGGVLGGVGQPGGVLGGVGQPGGLLGQGAGGVGVQAGVQGGALGQGVGVGVQPGGALGGAAGGLGLGGQAGAQVSVQPVRSRADVEALVNLFRSECGDDPPDGALLGCINKARALRLSCSGGR